MFAVSNLLVAAADVLSFIFTALYWLILIRALISWVNPDPYNPIVQLLYKLTEPVLEPIRKMLPVGLRFSMDISPIIAFLLIMFLRSFLIKTLIELSLRMR